MALGTFDEGPPPLFKQGPSALSKLIFFSALSLFLMVADTRFGMAQPLRSVIATMLYPLESLPLQLVYWVRNASEYFAGLQQARAIAAQAQLKLAQQAVRSSQVSQLTLENERLRKLLGLREQFGITATSAQVLYDAADLYARKVVIDKGRIHGIELGSPVMDEFGVLGQVTRVYPVVSEVTLVIDRDLSIPVLNVRTGARSVAYGDPAAYGEGLELRFMAANADVQQGDLLTTSGVDGVYPPGVPVARIAKIERRAESAFARIHCKPQAVVTGALHVMVIRPLSGQIPVRPEPEPAGVGGATPDKGASK